MSQRAVHLDLSWDAAGDPRAQAAAGDSAAALLGRYLEADIQTNATQARETLHVIDRILAGRLRTWTDTGNAHTLTLTRRDATLESTVDDAAKPEKLALEDFREALSAWLAFLQQGRLRGAD